MLLLYRLPPELHGIEKIGLLLQKNSFDKNLLNSIEGSQQKWITILGNFHIACRLLYNDRTKTALLEPRKPVRIFVNIY